MRNDKHREVMFQERVRSFTQHNRIKLLFFGDGSVDF